MPQIVRLSGRAAALGRMVLLGLLAIAPAAAHAEAQAAQPLSAAVFGFDFLDTSEEGAMFGKRADEAQRVQAASDELRRLLAAGGIRLVDLAPAAARIAKAQPLTKCNGCDLEIARDLGADLAITGLIQKVSNLILNFNVTVRDARTGAFVRAGSVDIRGNTDESWRRGIGYLVRNRLLDPPLRINNSP